MSPRRVSGAAALLIAWFVLACGSPSAPAQSAKEKELVALYEQAGKLERGGKLAEALVLYEKATALAEELFGRTDPNLAAFYGQQAEVQQKLGNRPKAEALYLHCLKLTENERDADVVKVRNILGLRLAQLYQTHQEAARAEALLRQVLQESKGNADVEPMAKGILAQLLFGQNRYDQAEPLFVQALAGLEAQADPSGLVPVLQGQLGKLYWSTGRGDRAEAFLKQSLQKLRQPNVAGEAFLTAGLVELYRGTSQFKKGQELADRFKLPTLARPSDATAVLTLSVQFSQMFKDQGDYGRAESYLRQTVELMEKRYGPRHRYVADTLVLLANLQADMNEFARAEASLTRAAEIVEGSEGAASPRLGKPLFGLACMQMARGDLAQAERTFQRCVKILEAAPDPQTTSMLALMRANMANLYLGGGRIEEAEKLNAQAIQQMEAGPGGESVELGRLLVLQGLLYLQEGERDKALPLLERSWKVLERKLGPDHLYIADVFSLLASCHRQAKQYALARQFLTRSVRINEALGTGNLRVGYNLRELAQLHQASGELPQAQALLRRVREIFEQKLGADHPQLAELLADLGKLQIRQKAYREASQSLHEARRIDCRHVHRVLPALSEAEQLAFLDTGDRPRLQTALSLALLRRQDQTLIDLSAAWVVNGKAVGWQALSQRLIWARRSQDSKIGTLVQQWMALRNEYAALNMSAPRPGGEQARGDRLRELWQKQEELSRQIGLQQEAGGDPWIDLAKIRAAVPNDAVLVELARVEVINFDQEEKEAPARYAAWIIPPGKVEPVRLIDLGEARPIEEAIQAFRAAMRAAPRTILQKGERESEAELRQHLEAIGRRALAPLLEHVGGKTRWLICPDEDLWLVPWSALPLADRRYVVERHTVSHLVSSRDLVAPRAPASTAPALVLADPDYDLAPEQISKLPPPVTSAGALTRISSSWGRLPGTAKEVQAITPSLQKLSGKATVLQGKDAREEALKAARAPSILVLSTHGYFLEPAVRRRPITPLGGGRGPLEIVAGSQAIREPNATEVLLTDRRTGEVLRLGDFMLKLEHPLLVCGLALASANQRGKRATGDDGILTGLEIASLDLHGTQLAVLSACETGIGRVERVAGGVAGLRQAFQLAGARSVAATLWKIPDEETAMLMESFFQNLAAGQGSAEALRKAQFTLIEQRRQNQQLAHPFYWAACTGSGEW